MHQMKLNEITNQLFEYLVSYNEEFNLGIASFVNAILKIAELLRVDLENFKKNRWCDGLDEHFKHVNIGQVDSLRFLFKRMASNRDDTESIKLVRMLLRTFFV